jgi:hypothetical protein
MLGSQASPKNPSGRAGIGGRSVQRTIVAIDVAGLPPSDEHQQRNLRASVRAIVAETLAEQGIALEPNGDLTCVVVPRSLPPRTFVGAFLTSLSVALRVHRRVAAAAVPIRLRVALHFGPVGAGTAARLIGAAPVRAAADAVASADLVAVLSEPLFRAAISDGEAIDPALCQPIPIDEPPGVGWLYLPGHRPPLPGFARRAAPALGTVDPIHRDLRPWSGYSRPAAPPGTALVFGDRGGALAADSADESVRSAAHRAYLVDTRAHAASFDYQLAGTGLVAAVSYAWRVTDPVAVVRERVHDAPARCRERLIALIETLAVGNCVAVEATVPRALDLTDLGLSVANLDVHVLALTAG